MAKWKKNWLAFNFSTIDRTIREKHFAPVDKIKFDTSKPPKWFFKLSPYLLTNHISWRWINSTNITFKKRNKYTFHHFFWMVLDNLHMKRHYFRSVNVNQPNIGDNSSATAYRSKRAFVSHCPWKTIVKTVISSIQLFIAWYFQHICMHSAKLYIENTTISTFTWFSHPRN